MNRRGFVKSVLGAATIVAIPSTLVAESPLNTPAPARGKYRFNLANPARISPLEFARAVWKDKALYPWQERVLEAMSDAHAAGKKLTVTWPPRRPRCVYPTP